MNRVIKLMSGIFFLFISSLSFSQTPEMATELREGGKIYIVVAVVMTVLIGLFIYLFITDKKVSKIEEELKAISNDETNSIEKSNL